MAFIDEFNFFFQNPIQPPMHPSARSTLWALRRDVDFCLGKDRANKSIRPEHALWPVAMTIFAGIDMLGKFEAGEDGIGGSGCRFKTFLQKYFSLSVYNSVVIYDIRNALVHSFSLSINKKEYHIDLSFLPGKQLIEGNGKPKWIVDIATLYNEFEQSIARFMDAISHDLALQKHFATMFEKYGAFGTY